MLAGALALGVGTYVLTTPDDGGGGDDPPSDAAVSIAGVAERGDPAPDVRAPGLDGDPVRLSELRGEPVVINFWASWCHPCRREFPVLREIYEDGTAVIGIVFDDIASDAEAFADEMDATWPMAVDEDGAIGRAYGVRGLPQTFFVGSDGTIQDRLYRFTSEEELRERARELE